jgi:arsenate reductase
MTDVKSAGERESRPESAAAPSRTRDTAPLARRLLAEAVGTGLLVTVVVGSGIAAQRLSPGNVGLELLENSTATVFGLAVLILAFGPVSGAHFNPVVSAADWLLGHHSRHGLRLRDVGAYTLAQSIGAIAGAVLANAMYSLAPVQVSTHHRATPGILLGEVVATAGLIVLIFALARSGRAPLSAAAVGAYIGSAYWFTSSTSFANPAVTIGRVFSNTFAGIAPASVAPFIAAQILGAGLGAALVLALYPDIGQATDDVVVTHIDTHAHPDRHNPDRSSRPPANMQPLRTLTRKVLPMATKSPTGTPSVLFVCIHNAGRSQMAAGWLTALAGDRIEVRSAGTAPGTEVNPAAIEAMREVGIALAAAKPKILTPEAVEVSDVVITMGCGDTCPFYPGTRYLDWPLDDPAGQGIAAVRPIRDAIKAKVEQLITELLPERASA